MTAERRRLTRSERAAALELLGLPEGAGRQEIVEAYRRAAKRLHPDRDTTSGAAARFAEVAEACRALLRDAAAAPTPPTDARPVQGRPSQARSTHERAGGIPVRVRVRRGPATSEPSGPPIVARPATVRRSPRG